MGRVEIDLQAIEIAALSHPNPSMRDEARINEIVSQIRPKFPEIDGRKTTLKNIMARFKHASYFDGMVLDLGGKIDASNGVAPINLKELDEIKDKAKVLRQNYDEALRKNANMQVQAQNVERENKRLTREIETLRFDMNDLRIKAQQCDEEKKRAKAEFKRAIAENTQLRTNNNQTEQQVSATQINLELVQRQLRNEQAQRQKDAEQLQKQYQADLALLRQSVNNATQKEQQLRDTLKKREDEITVLRERLRQLVEESPSEDAHAGVNDDPFEDM